MRGHEHLEEKRGFMKRSTITPWTGYQEAPKRKMAADPESVRIEKEKLKKKHPAIKPKKPKIKPVKKSKMTEAEYNELRRIRGLATRRERCMATFKNDVELTTLQLSDRLNLCRMSALFVIKGWRDFGLVCQAYEVGVKDVKTWRLTVS